MRHSGMETFNELQQNLSASSIVLTGKGISYAAAMYLVSVVIPNCLLASILFGLLGFVGNAFTFLQFELRSNTCCIYTLASSVVDVFHLLINILPDYLRSKYGGKEMWTSNNVTCKIYFFIYSFLPNLAINLLILTIFDRYSCTCPLGSRFHRFNQPRMIPKMICGAIVTSAFFSTYGLILGYLNATACGYREGRLYALLNICINGITQPVVMLIFVLLTYRNVIKSRQRVDRVTITGSNRFRNQFIAMIITQVLMTAVISLQWMICQTYLLFNQDSFRLFDKYIFIMLFVSFTNVIYSLNNVKSFYFSMLTSRLYRQTFIKGLRRLLPRHARR